MGIYFCSFQLRSAQDILFAQSIAARADPHT